MGSLCSFRFDKDIDSRIADLLVIYVSTENLDIEEFSKVVDREVQGSLAPDEMVVIARRTAAGKIVSGLRSEPAFDGARTRLGRAAISVLSFGAKGNETDREVISGASCIDDIPLQELTRRAVSAIFAKHGGFVEANPSYHFLNPSNRHTDRFIRLSNLLIHSAEISLIAATLLPFMPVDASVVHVDTPALFAIVAALNEHLQILSSSRNWLRCENFRSYFGAKTHDFRVGGESVVLISASSSGSLARMLINDRGVLKDRIAHVLYLGEKAEDHRAATDLSYDEDTNPEGVADDRKTFEDGNCSLCDKGSIPVKLRGDQFDMGAPIFDPITLKKADAPAGLAATIARIAGHEGLRVSVDHGARARQFDVDVHKLLESPEFSKRIAYLARRFVPSTTQECIVLDSSSQPLADTLIAEAGLTPVIRERSRLSELRKEDTGPEDRPLNGCPILIIGGVIESGRSLRDISRDLRSSRPNSPQIYLVGLAKNASVAARSELEKTLAQTHEPSAHAFAAAEELILPPKSFPNAWAAERQFLNGMIREGLTPSERLRDRLAVLNQSSEVLIENLLVSVDTEPLRIQPGFVFWPPSLSQRPVGGPSQADVYFTICSVLQKLRTSAPDKEGRSIRSNWFQQTRLDPANFGRFNDGVIQASILRGARPVEIDYSEVGELASEASRILCRLLEAAHAPRGEAACEILIAIGSGRLRLPPAQMEELLQDRDTYPPLVAELAAACRKLVLQV